MPLITPPRAHTGRAFLEDLFRSDNVGFFKFDGHYACTTFLVKACWFRRDPQVLIKSRIESDASMTIRNAWSAKAEHSVPCMHIRSTFPVDLHFNPAVPDGNYTKLQASYTLAVYQTIQLVEDMTLEIDPVAPNQYD